MNLTPRSFQGWWGSATEEMHSLAGTPSIPSEWIAMVAVDARPGGETFGPQLMMAVRIGYLLRASLEDIGISNHLALPDVSSVANGPIVALAERAYTGEPFEFDDEAALPLIQTIADVVEAYLGPRFPEIMAIDGRLWNAVVWRATYELQQNYGRRFDAQPTEELLRLGFALRAMDEALDIVPDPDRFKS